MTSAALVSPEPVASAPVTAPAPAARRIETVDLLRGLVIVIMVLDHVRDYFSRDAFLFAPTDLSRASAALFLTRWITHLCAPTFVFLAGTSAYLQRRRARERGESLAPVARFLVTRGLWLVLLEVTVVSFALHFAAPFLFLEVIWAIGFGLVTLAALLWLPPAVVLALGLVVVGSHDWLALPTVAGSGAGRFWLGLGPLPGALATLPGFVAYPALPWAGVMWAGYGLGWIFARPAAERRRALLATGGIALTLFAALRVANGYGEPVPWSPQPRGALFTALSVINVSKYPPSLQFVLLTLGVSLPLGAAVDAWLERAGGAVARGARHLLLAVGRTPLFVFVVHLYLVHALAMLVGALRGVPARDFTGFLDGPARLRDAGWGVSLPTVYLLWALVVAAMYPLARWFGRHKQRGTVWWLRYL